MILQLTNNVQIDGLILGLLVYVGIPFLISVGFAFYIGYCVGKSK